MQIQYLYENDYEKLFCRELSVLPVNPRILNVACENDLMPHFLRERFSKADVWGVEVNKDIVERNNKIRYCDVDNDELPFEDNSFDAVISIWGMEHFQEEKLFFEAGRVLKSGGSFIFVTPNASNPAFFIVKMLGGSFGRWYYKNFLKNKYVPHEAYYRFNSQKTISFVAKRGGLRIKQMIYFGPSNFLEYFAFSGILQKVICFWEKVITNRFLFFLKPYILVSLEKDRE